MTEIRPQPGPQETFLSTSADVAIYGGAAGGGKTFGLLFDAVRWTEDPYYTAIIFRQTTPQIRNPGGLWDASVKLYKLIPGSEGLESSLNWRFPSGARIKFSHLEYEKDVYDHQGSEYAFIGFDELTHFSWKQFSYLLSRNRTSGCKIKPYIRATTNPDADSWVAEFISWYIGEDGYPIKERGGVIRYFTVVDNTVLWGATRAEVAEASGLPEDWVKSFTFVPASIEDNKILLENDKSYLANLNALSRVEKERLLKGNWRIKHAAGLIFKREEVELVSEESVPKCLRRVRSWDFAATEVTTDSPNPDRTAGVLMGFDTATKDIYIIDMIHGAYKSATVRKLFRDAADQDDKVVITIPQDPGQAGKDQADNLAKEVPHRKVVKVRPTHSKLVRSEPFASAWQNRRVKVVIAPWNGKFFAELEGFPDKDYHDDMVDACSDAYTYLVTEKKVYIAVV